MMINCNTAQKIIKPREVAEILGTSPNFIYTILESGELPGIKVGGRWLVPISAVDELLDRAAAPKQKGAI